MPVTIKGSVGGSVTLDAGAASSDTILTLPNTTGSVLVAPGGILPVTAGGTGAATLTANAVLIGNGTSAVTAVAPSTNGNVLTSNGTAWTSAAPAAGATTWADVTGSRALGTTYTNSTGKTITAMVSMTWQVGGQGNYQVYVGAVQIASGGGNASYNSTVYKTVDVISFPIPNGATYRIATSGLTLTLWAEFT